MSNLLQNQSLEEKLLEGYMYRNTPIKSTSKNERMISLHTGVGGAKLLINAYREQGLPDEVIATFIQVLTDDFGWVSLANVVVKKKS